MEKLSKPKSPVPGKFDKKEHNLKTLDEPLKFLPTSSIFLRRQESKSLISDKLRALINKECTGSAGKSNLTLINRIMSKGLKMMRQEQ